MAAQDSLAALQEKLANEQKLVHLIDRIHSAKSLDSIFLEIQGDILVFLEADRMTLYAADIDKKELYSKFLALDAVKEIRLPVNESSVAGYVATSRQTVNIGDAYDTSELGKINGKLRFDASWDKKTGYRTKQILAMPILHENRVVVGVIQLLNKKKGGRFTKDDELNVARIAKTLGVAFHNQQQMGRSRGTKFDYLLAQGLVTQEDINAAIAGARHKNTDVEAVLMDQYKIPKHEIGAALSQFYRVPFVEFDERVIPPPDLMKDLKLEYLKRNLWLPLRRERDGTTLVLIDNPQDIQRVDSIHQVMRNHKVQLAVALRKDIQQFLAVAGGEGTSPRASMSEILSDLGNEAQAEKDQDISGGEVDENDSAVIRLANQVIVDAYKARASDIHIEPYGPQKDTMIRLRIDGSCNEYQRVPGAFRRALVARIKIMATLDIAERTRHRAARGDRAHAGRQRGCRHAHPHRQRTDPGRQARHARPQPARDQDGGRKAVRPDPVRGAHRLGQDDDAALAPGLHQQARAQDLDGRGPRRNHAVWAAAGAGAAQDRLHVRAGDARLPARRPRRHHGR